MQAKSQSIQEFKPSKTPISPTPQRRPVLRPPLPLFSEPTSSPIFRPVTPQGYLRAGLAVEPGWHSNFRACYYAMLHVLLEDEPTRQTIEFRRNFERVLEGEGLKMDAYKKEQVDAMYRPFYNQEVLLALIIDFIGMVREGRGLLQMINQYPIIDLALILFLRAIVNANENTLLSPPLSFSHIPSSQLANAITSSLQTPVDYNEQTGEIKFLEFNLVLKEELGEVVIREVKEEQAMNRSDVMGFAGLLQEEGDKDKEQTMFQRLPFQESFEMDEQEAEEGTDRSSPMKDSCYLKLKELYQSNLTPNFQSNAASPLNTPSPVKSQFRVLQDTPIFEPKYEPNRIQLFREEPKKGNKVGFAESIKFEIKSNNAQNSKIPPDRKPDNSQPPSRIQRLKTQTSTSPSLPLQKYNIKISYQPPKKQPLLYNPNPPIRFQPPQKDPIRYYPSMKNLTLNDGVTSDDVLNILSPSIKKCIYEASGREENGDRNKSMGGGYSGYSGYSYSGQSNSSSSLQQNQKVAVYRQVPMHSEPVKFQVRKAVTKPLLQNQGRSYKDLIKAPANIKIPAGLFKTNSFASTFQGDNSQHLDLQTLQPTKPITGTSSQHTHWEPPILDPRLQLTHPSSTSTLHH